MMKQKRFNGAVFSLAALLTTGCVGQPYSQVQLGYANTRHKEDLGGHVDLLCVRARGGAKDDEQGGSKSSAWKGEFRLGTDICYGKLPYSISERKYSVDVPIVEVAKVDVEGTASSRLVKIAVPFLEYRYLGLGANFPGKSKNSILRSPDAEDLSIGLWASGGYAVDLTISETDYNTKGAIDGSIDDVPGIDVEGKFYGELINEITLFGKIPLDLSLRMDKDTNVTPSFYGGYRIQW